METHTERVFQAIRQLQILTNLFIKKRRELAARVGLTEAQWRLLDEIEQNDFMPSLFASERENTKAAISKTLRQLVDASLITVEISAHDARQRKYSLTPLAEEKLRKLTRLREEAIQKIWMPIDERLLDPMLAFNEALISNLRNFR